MGFPVYSVLFYYVIFGVFCMSVEVYVSIMGVYLRRFHAPISPIMHLQPAQLHTRVAENAPYSTHYSTDHASTFRTAHYLHM